MKKTVLFLDSSQTFNFAQNRSLCFPLTSIDLLTERYRKKTISRFYRAAEPFQVKRNKVQAKSVKLRLGFIAFRMRTMPCPYF